MTKLDAELFTPFTIASGSHRRLENAMFTLEAAGGERDCGEAAIATHLTGETRTGTMKSLEAAGEALAGADVANHLGVLCQLEGLLDGNRLWGGHPAAAPKVNGLNQARPPVRMAQTLGGRLPLQAFHNAKGGLEVLRIDTE